MKGILIIGASGHAKVIIDIIELRNEYKIIGLIDSFKPIGEKVNGYSIIGNEQDIQELFKSKNVIGGVIAIGDNWTRSNIKKYITAKVPSFKFIPVIHPNAILHNNFRIQEGIVIMAGAIINSGAEVSEFCLINTKASLGHESKMKKFSSLAPNVTIGGNSEIGEYSIICMSATIIQNLKIGIHCLIGACALVLDDIDDNAVSYGIPSKVIRKRNIGDSYLSN